jgi:hypothetical protein
VIKVFSIDKNILSNDLLTTSEISFLREVNTFINLTHELEEQKSYLEKTVYAIPSALLGIFIRIYRLLLHFSKESI